MSYFVALGSVRKLFYLLRQQNSNWLSYSSKVILVRLLLSCVDREVRLLNIISANVDGFAQAGQ
jgi:hypothetical protein